jgi:hypothetical protein
MIITALSGGLGNQMFQYALGYSAALRLRTDLWLDLTWYQKNSLHNGFELDKVFGINQAASADPRIIRYLGFCARRRVQFIPVICNFTKLLSHSIYSEPSYQYWPGIELAPDNSYFSGYWQTDRYFHSVSEHVRSVYSFPPPTGGNAQIAAKIKGCESVSIHVRRGDYFSNSANKSVHGVDLSSYYRSAIDLMLSKISEPHFFLFSDDPREALKLFQGRGDVTLVDNNRGSDSYKDMQLMSQCRHHILANSTFSWWGAWLGNHAKGLTVAPSNWFVDKQIDTSDLYCKHWTII